MSDIAMIGLVIITMIVFVAYFAQKSQTYYENWKRAERACEKFRKLYENLKKGKSI